MTFYFIGIKGTGMASLATMLHDLGYEVLGSDLEKHFFTENPLIERGIKILPFDENNIQDNMTIVIGNAFKEDFPEVVKARNNKTCKCYRYHEYLGVLAKNYKTLAVAGSHGKTTTTTMAKDVVGTFKNTGYLIGDGEGHITKDSEYLCVEADEFERHFITLYPEYAIVTNIEIDHVDYFKDEDDYFSAYQELVDHTSKGLIYCGDDKWCKKLKTNIPMYSYGFGENNDFRIVNLKETDKYSEYDLYYKNDLIYHYHLPFVGHHMLLDSLSVIAYGHLNGFDHKAINKTLNNYHGPKRRYVVEEYNDSIFIDDYAHHPTEVKVTLEATIKRYPNRNIVAIFKPHRASRVQYFVKEFADALKLVKDVYLIDFTSIDDKQDGVDIDIAYLQKEIPGSVILPENEDGAKILAKHKGSVYVFMSSKDIYNIANMTKKYL